MVAISVAKLFWCWLNRATSVCTVASSDGLGAIKYQSLHSSTCDIYFVYGLKWYFSGFVIRLDYRNSHGTL